MLMKEWGIPFHVIEDNWTEDQFWAHVDALMAMQKRNRRHAQKGSKETHHTGSMSDFLRSAGVKV